MQPEDEDVGHQGAGARGAPETREHQPCGIGQRAEGFSRGDYQKAPKEPLLRPTQ